MSSCARCGQGICSTAGKVALNKVWHKCCFTCYNCSRPLHVDSAKIYYGEVFCNCCCPEEIYPLKVCRVNSTPSFNPECPVRVMKPVCCGSSDLDCCRPRDVHSCSCIPACCTPPPACSCRDCEDPCYKRIHCRPRSPKPLNYPPRQRPVCCACPKCCPKTPRVKTCMDPCCPKRNRTCVPNPCCEQKNKFFCMRSCSPPPCYKTPHNQCCRCCNTERCKRCGEKVFAAEKVLTSNGGYHLGCFSCCCCCKSLCMKSMYEACGEIYCKRCYNNHFGVSGYGYCC